MLYNKGMWSFKIFIKCQSVRIVCETLKVARAQFKQCY
jgi:hypothetical protein